MKKRLLTSLAEIYQHVLGRAVASAGRSPISIVNGGGEKEFKPVSLALDSDPSLEPVVDQNRACATFVISTPRRDRHGDIVEPEGCAEYLDDYRNNPVNFFAHKSSEYPLGVCRSPEGLFEFYPSKDNITSTTYFHLKTEESNTVFALVAEKILRTASIGFIPTEAYILEAEDPDQETKDDEDPIYFDQGGLLFRKFSIFEWSIVAVPANPDALAVAFSRGMIGDTKFAPSIKEALKAYIPPGKVWVPGVSYEKPAQVTSLEEAAPEDDTIRWNKSLSKKFDVTKERLKPADAELEFVSKFLGCKIKEVYETHTLIPSAKMAGFLCAWQDTTVPFDLKDVRNILWNGTEAPPSYEELQCGSHEKKDFLVNGICFYAHKEGAPLSKLVTSIKSSWFGLSMTHYVIKSEKKGLLDLIEETWELTAQKYNFLKGEAFALSGEFLPKTLDSFEGLFLKEDNQKSLERTLKNINEKQEAFANRGAIFLGPPGTGKTLSGRILRNQAQSTFIWVSARDFGYAGAFGSLAYAFALARELAPTVLFIEDIDHWLDNYSIDMLKTEMDGISRSSGVWTILTTNFPEELPEALIDRPGRFHDVLEFNLPDKDCRREMIEKWLGKALDEATLLKALAATEGYSGAHVYELCHFARTLQEQEEHTLSEAVLLALDKIKKQRELIGRQGVRRKSFVMNKAISGEKLVDYVPRLPAVTKTVVPYGTSGKAPRNTPWKASVEIKKAGNDLKMLKYMCTWYDGKAADKKSSYKLPHHKAGSLKTVWNGVRAAMGALLGARGGTKIPAGERKGVFTHLKKHYKEFGETAPDFHKSYSPEELEKLFGDIFPLIDEINKTMADDLDREDDAPEHEADSEDVAKMDSEQMDELHDLMKGLHEKVDALHADHKALAVEHKALHESHKSMYESLDDLHAKMDALVEDSAEGDAEEEDYDQEEEAALDEEDPDSEEEEEKEIDPQDEGRDEDGEEKEVNPDDDEEEPEDEGKSKKKKKPVEEAAASGKQYARRGSASKQQQKQLNEMAEVIGILLTSQEKLQKELFKMTGKRKYAPRQYE